MDLNTSLDTDLMILPAEYDITLSLYVIPENNPRILVKPKDAVFDEYSCTGDIQSTNPTPIKGEITLPLFFFQRASQGRIIHSCQS